MKKGNVTFKAYTMGQPSLQPLILEELIPEEHLVRVVEAIDLDPLLAKYTGGGTNSYQGDDVESTGVYLFGKGVHLAADR
jgi:hypothetical protein